MVAIAAILARKQKWLLPPTLAAALLLPSVAAIHGIVLAALHVDSEYQFMFWGSAAALGMLLHEDDPPFVCSIQPKRND